MRWYVSRNGETVGPVDWATLYEWGNRGWISPDMYLGAEGGNAWVPVEQTPVRALMRSNAASDGAAAAAAAAVFTTFYQRTWSG
jgi:hypothetical protein